MASNVVNGYTILLMNTKYTSPAKTRQEAFNRVVKDTKPSIIFLQETTGPFVKVIKGIRPQAYIGIGVKYEVPSMIVDMNEFTYIDLSATKAGDLTKLVDKLDKEKSAPNPRVSADFEFPLTRLRVVKFTSKGVHKLEVLAISWHGPNNNYDYEKRKRLLKDFYVVVKEIRALFRGADELLPVIVGGDFNLKFSLWPEDDVLIPQKYTPSKRREKNQIDFFLTTKELHASGVKYYDMSFELEDGAKAGDLLKHDPVEAVLSVRINPDTSSSGVADATEQFQKLGIQK